MAVTERGVLQSPSAAIDLANRRLTHLNHQRVHIVWIDGASDRVPRYIAYAAPGTPLGPTGLASKTWRICRITWDNFDNPIDVEWPDDSRAYAYAPNEVASLNWGS